MFARVWPRTLVVVAMSIGFLGVGVVAFPVAAQSLSDVAQQQHPAADAPSGQDAGHQHNTHDLSHEHGGDGGSRDGSGTAWQPDETPMYAIHGQGKGWTLMTHGNLFFQYLHESGNRGSHQTGGINWVMGMADRPVGGGHLGLRGMISLEPWTIRGCGYPDLLATGEVCKGDPIQARQHPHDLFMELAAEYDRPVGGGVRIQVYGRCTAARSESLRWARWPSRTASRRCRTRWRRSPTTGSTPRTSRYGVVTGGLYGNRWKAEASLFNGREPDENRTDFDFGALDSWSGRVWFLPTKQWALQVSAGRLNEAEPGHAGDARVDIDRVTASATYHRMLQPGRIWASTVGWGRNSEPGTGGTHALLVETNVTVDERDAWFGRFELSGKSARDLGVDSPDSFTVAKAQSGYTRYFGSWNGLTCGVGASVSTGVVPETLERVYGSRFNFGFGVFVTLRAAEHRGQ
jgi:hypothetical protein